MNRNFEDILRDPVFWASMLIILLPLAFGGAMMVWSQ
jgi:hypothetical protein